VKLTICMPVMEFFSITSLLVEVVLLSPARSHALWLKFPWANKNAYGWVTWILNVIGDMLEIMLVSIHDNFYVWYLMEKVENVLDPSSSLKAYDIALSFVI